MAYPNKLVLSFVLYCTNIPCLLFPAVEAAAGVGSGRRLDGFMLVVPNANSGTPNIDSFNSS